MKAHVSIFILFIMVVVSACGGQADGNKPDGGEVEVGGSVSVSDQDVSDGVILLKEVRIEADGWVVIHTENSGKPGPVIGFTKVNAGVNKNVEVLINVSEATPKLYAMLHLDGGLEGEYEFPGEDAPLKVGGTVVNVPFYADLGYDPEISATFQGTRGGKVVVDRVVAEQTGWVVIHIDSDGKPGAVIGYTQVSAGVSQGVEVAIDLAQATPKLFAMLHVDDGVIGEYEFPGVDVPVNVDGEMVNIEFGVELMYDPEIMAGDQDASSGMISIDRVVAEEAGWIVIHAEEGGKPGAVIGYAKVEAGVNENVEVKIDLSKATETLFAMLHRDAGTAGEFEFPGVDTAIQVGDGVVMASIYITLP